MDKTAQYVSTEVSVQKFNTELGQFLKNQKINRERGIFLLEADFPNIKILFTSILLKPAALVFAVNIGFDNYDFSPPSLKFINPFTFQPVTNLNEMPTHFARKKENKLIPLLMQNKGGVPFLCIPGVREYHEHPRHTGDSWFLHRAKGGEGTLGYLIEKLFEYGVSPITNYQIPNMGVNGLSLGINLNLVQE